MDHAERIEVSVNEDRFSRFELISWWDQPRLRAAKVLVIGAGALGNEILKNLALLGVGNVVVADLDKIENSNLSRSVLFRAEDCGQPKAAIAARGARQIYPEMRVQPFHGNVVYDLGLGVFRWADVILGDSIIARRAWPLIRPPPEWEKSGSTARSNVSTAWRACSIRR